MSAPQSDGETLRVHLGAYEKMTGEPHPMTLEAPRLPDGGALLWADFLELHNSRGSTGMGPARITYSDMQAYQAMTGANLRPWQVAAIRRLDSAWFEQRAVK